MYNNTERQDSHLSRGKKFMLSVEKRSTMTEYQQAPKRDRIGQIKKAAKKLDPKLILKRTRENLLSLKPKIRK